MAIYDYYVTPGRISDLRDVGSMAQVRASVLDALVVDRVGKLLKPRWRGSDGVEGRVGVALRRVVLGADLIRLVIARESCRIDACPDAPPTADTFEILIPIRLKHRHSATLLAPVDQTITRSGVPDRSLLRAVCIARIWRGRLESGEVATTRALARLEGLCHRHTGRLLPLAYLAPDLVEAIVEGRQPQAMTLQALTASPLPRSWRDQCKLVASFA